jgi:hypothetical protein
MKLKFIVLSDERTGTNLVTRTLGNHSKISVWTEPFRHPQLFSMNKSWKIEDVIENVFKNVNGCALHRTSHQPPNLPPQWQSLWTVLPKMIPDLKVINVYRENLLARYVSLQVAIKLSKWIDVKSVPKLPTVHINPVNAEQDFNRMTRIYEDRLEHFSGHPWIPVKYEYLVSNMDSTFKILQNFLRVEYESLVPATLKREDRPLENVIENYEEVYNYFKDTEWFKFFK